MKKLLLLLVACLPFISCSNTDPIDGGLNAVYFDVKSADLIISVDDYDGTFFVRNKYDDKINTGWELSELVVVENGVESTIENTLIDDMPVNTYKMRMSGEWFSILNDVDKLKVYINKNETGVERVLTIKIGGFLIPTESLTIRQKAD